MHIGAQQYKVGKMFFFEKKNQKTFDRCRGPLSSTYLKK
jgi:hypothetical protein